MLVFSGKHHVIELCASKVRCYREGVEVSGGLTFNRKKAKDFLPCEQWFLQAGR